VTTQESCAESIEVGEQTLDPALAHEQGSARRGEIGIFNRSHYEEVVALRVHPKWFEKQRLPATTTRKRLEAET
jgi:hypothetical protein